MKKVTLRTPVGSYDLELLESQGEIMVATISKHLGATRYLHLCEVPKMVRKYIKANYKVELLDVNALNYMFGLC
jgi:hypothetical protein